MAKTTEAVGILRVDLPMDYVSFWINSEHTELTVIGTQQANEGYGLIHVLRDHDCGDVVLARLSLSSPEAKESIADLFDQLADTIREKKR